MLKNPPNHFAWAFPITSSTLLLLFKGNPLKGSINRFPFSSFNQENWVPISWPKGCPTSATILIPLSDPRRYVSTPGAKEITILLLRLKLKAVCHTTPLSVLSGVPVNETSSPRFLISPALIRITLKRLDGATGTSKIWSLVEAE